MYILNFHHGEKWLQGSIVEVTGPASFVIELINGARVRRHQDQLRHCIAQEELTMDSSITAEASPPAETLAENPVALQTPPVVAQNPAGVANSSSEIISRRYPQRSHCSPDCYKPTL